MSNITNLRHHKNSIYTYIYIKQACSQGTFNPITAILYSYHQSFRLKHCYLFGSEDSQQFFILGHNQPQISFILLSITGKLGFRLSRIKHMTESLMRHGFRSGLVHGGAPKTDLFVTFTREDFDQPIQDWSSEHKERKWLGGGGGGQREEHQRRKEEVGRSWRWKKRSDPQPTVAFFICVA